MKTAHYGASGAVSIAVVRRGVAYGSGTGALSLWSQADLQGTFQPVVRSAAVASIAPYLQFVEAYRAFPVQHADGGGASRITTFRFIPPTCGVE